MEAVRAENLHKTYGEGDTEVRALRGVSVSAEGGEVVALLGPSGSGKSTLLTAHENVRLAINDRKGPLTHVRAQELLDYLGVGGRAVMELFRKVAREQGTAVIVVTHDHRTLDVFDTTFEMEDGQIRSA